ncbi:MAG TPA: hypothetical protein VE287_05805, partial [Actinopolymorphaceae bacterium]|nr:hypothetical protein [Actinopolymorphaceae bacterium]
RAQDELRTLVTAVLDRCPPDRPGGVLLGLARDGKAQLVLEVTRPMGEAGVTARELLMPAGRMIGGGAGGVGRLGHAGGREVAELDAAMAEAARQMLGE